MLRDKSLVPLSRQHQHVLALCVRIDRASPITVKDLSTWQAEIVQLFELEVEIHFRAEEQSLFPVASHFTELRPLIADLQSDHLWLRECYSGAEAQTMSAADLSALTQRFSAHIRKEERQLFERLQQLLTPQQLMALGPQLEDALKESAQACAVPKVETAVHPAKTS